MGLQIHPHSRRCRRPGHSGAASFSAWNLKLAAPPVFSSERLQRMILAADLQPVLILLLGGHAAPDMALRFVDIQHNPRAGRQRGIDVF